MIVAPDPHDGLIASVDAVPLTVPFTHAGGRRGVTATGGTWRTLDLLLVRIETREGLVGWGESFAYALRGPVQAVIETRLAPLLVGRTVSDARAGLAALARSVHSYGRGGVVQFAHSGIDIALWDLTAKQSEVPLMRLLGAEHPSHRAYASLFRYCDPALVAEVSAAAVADGFKDLKLHESEVASVAAAREAAGPATSIATDVNCIWDVSDASTAIRSLEPFDLAWVEEPIWPPEDVAALRRLRSVVTTPIAAGENEPNAVSLGRMAREGAVDILQPSITKIGGVSALIEIARDAAETDLALIPHSFYYGPGLLATLHTVGLAGPDPIVEWMYADPEADIFGPALRPREGRITLPPGDGLGADPSPDVLREYGDR